MRSELAFCRDIPSHKKSTGYPEDKKFRIPEINIPKLRKIPRLKRNPESRGISENHGKNPDDQKTVKTQKIFAS